MTETENTPENTVPPVENPAEDTNLPETGTAPEIEETELMVEEMLPETDGVVKEEELEAVEEKETEKEVQPQHQSILTPEHYLGSERVNPDNPMLEHMNPELYDSNKNKENR